MFNTIEEAIVDIKEGKMLVVIDDENRENEGDLLMAAEKVTPDAINFMATYGRGLICTPMEEELVNRLQIGNMVEKNTDNHETAFTVSVDYKDAETGISAYERAYTIQKLLDKTCMPEDFRRPGHVFPLVAKSNGVLERKGHTEAAVDLAKLSGFKGAGVICEIMNDDGYMARTKDLIKFAKKHNLKIITVNSLIEYRKNRSKMKRVVETVLPTKYGKFKLYGYENEETKEHHIALIKGEILDGENILTRVHSECLTGDVLGSMRCDCGEQYSKAMKLIEEKGRGILLYMRQEGRGIGLINKLKAYALQDKGFDTVEANIELGFKPDMRKFDVAVDILKDIGVKSVCLMTNNPKKIDEINECGLKVSSRVPLIIKANDIDKFYLETKKIKMNHMI